MAVSEVGYQHRQLQELAKALKREPSGAGSLVLFTGPAGAEKSVAADVLANALQLNLYRIDLSAVVSKYIGETEKNLARVFDETATQDVALFFDEADALFGRRSDVKESHDRYANVAITYFLERLEASPGFVFLSVTDIDVSRSLANRLRRRRCVIVR